MDQLIPGEKYLVKSRVDTGVSIDFIAEFIHVVDELSYDDTNDKVLTFRKLYARRSFGPNDRSLIPTQWVANRGTFKLTIEGPSFNFRNKVFSLGKYGYLINESVPPDAIPEYVNHARLVKYFPTKPELSSQESVKLSELPDNIKRKISEYILGEGKRKRNLKTRKKRTRMRKSRRS